MREFMFTSTELLLIVDERVVQRVCLLCVAASCGFEWNAGWRARLGWRCMEMALQHYRATALGLTAGRWRYSIWCSDCCGEDFQGCFDGGSELSEESYPSVELAEQAGRAHVGDCGLWEFEVIADSEEKQ